MLRHLMNNQSKLDKYMEQLYTGKKISRPSDDPVIAMKGMNYRTQVTEIEQYKRNINEVHHWMDNSDASLDKATQAMHRISELAVQASNSTYSDDELQSIQEEVKQLKAHLIDIGNTNVNGMHIFNGTNTDEAPISVDEDGNISVPEETDSVMIEVSTDTKLQVNVKGEEVFGQDFFNHIDSLIGRLDRGEGESDEKVDIGTSLSDLDENINAIVNSRADLGARMNRLELIENRLDEQEVIAKKTMSENEDVHFEEAITNLITQESLYRASLATGSRVIQPSLIDFLR